MVFGQNKIGYQRLGKFWGDIFNKAGKLVRGSRKKSPSLLPGKSF